MLQSRSVYNLLAVRTIEDNLFIENGTCVVSGCSGEICAKEQYYSTCGEPGATGGSAKREYTCEHNCLQHAKVTPSHFLTD